MTKAINIETRHEAKRGCGYRQPGGLYVVSGGEGVEVKCLPIPLHVCPTCNQGIKPTRSFQWINPAVLLPQLVDCRTCHERPGPGCLISKALIGKQGLMWIGSKFYTPQFFMQEARKMGISKRIPAVPKDFKLGEHWIYLGHREAIKPADMNDSEATATPGIFTIFKPTAIEYVVNKKDTKKKLKSLEKRGIKLVDVKPVPSATLTQEMLDGKQSVKVFNCPLGRPDKRELEGIARIKKVHQGDRCGVHADVEFDVEKGNTYQRWVFARDQI